MGVRYITNGIKIKVDTLEKESERRRENIEKLFDMIGAQTQTLSALRQEIKDQKEWLKNNGRR